ncbi:MAG: PD-(D/E)XK nuclease family protein [Muribaculaceae bacterium]|nr:PD-(D/E)XK nuclease family protein [Muribaculaceae bacterium]
MPTPFLQQVANHYLRVQALEDYCFVFPNRRSGQFFVQYLKEQLIAADLQYGMRRPHLMPCVTSINEFVGELSGSIAASDIEMIFALYQAYCQAMGSNAQEFDKFIYWAQLIIGDFNDIDKSLADADEIYQNLSDQHSLSSNYLSQEVQDKVRRIFGDSLFMAFFDGTDEAALWQDREKKKEEGNAAVDGPVWQEFVSLWNALSTIYHSYHEVLQAKGLVSPGMQLRQVAEQPPRQFRYCRLVFVGFGVLSAAEVKLFDYFKDEQMADFWWDYAGVPSMLEKAPHDPGALLIDGYCKRFGAHEIEPLEDHFPATRVVSVSSTVGQAKQAFTEVERMAGASSGIDTAIVLPDENLLVPLLHSAPSEKSLNVTLGYALRNSGIVSLMHIVARLHQQASKEKGEWTYYREDVYDILSHPLIKTYFTSQALGLSMELSRTNRFRVPALEFETLDFKMLFQPAMDSEEMEDDTDHWAGYLDNLLSFCDLLMSKMLSHEVVAVSGSADDEMHQDNDGGVTLSLQQAFLTMYIDVLNQLKRSLAECGLSMQLSSMFYLIDRLAASAIVPFTGRPLQGLQIMGLLETRSLDFKHIVILSMNERIFPRRRGINSFIPNYIRSAYGMSTIEQQEAIVSFNFYRLFNRAEQVTLIYDSSAQKMGSSEPSRFITQLEKVYGHKLHHVEMVPDVHTSASIAIEIPNAGLGLRELYTRDPDTAAGKYLSASAINKYINCPLSFYLHYVQRLNDDNEASDFMDYGTFGDIIHDTLRECYYNGEPGSVNGGGLSIDENHIVNFKNRQLDSLVKRNIKKHYLHVSEEKLDCDTSPLRGEALMLVDTIKSYIGFVLDYDLEEVKKNGPFKILECEESHRVKELEIGGEKFNFTYTPDRVDRLGDGTIRIVDYKTGKDETAFGYDDELSYLFNGSRSDRRKAILQLFLYCYAYMTENQDIKKMTPVIYKLASMEESGVLLKGGRGIQPQQYEFSMNGDMPVEQAFMRKMGETIKAIYEGNFSQAEEGSKACNYCRFIDFCRRMPTKQ